MNQWITESGAGFGVTLEVSEQLYSAKSKYQQIDIYQTVNYGRMLVLDGIVQLTEFDEFAYQEMLAHVPLFAHPSPEKVLVIGGGDGGVIREAAKHQSVKSIDICEIDNMVIEAAKKFLPSLACGFSDPRVSLHIADGAEFVASKKGEYDVIIIDSSDPIGPNESLFNESFYRNVKQALKPGGIVSAQSESYYLFSEVVIKLTKIFRKVFGNSRYSGMSVPTYPGGCIGACLATLGADPAKPSRAPADMKLKYYTAEVHKASFVLPKFADELLKEI